MPPIDKPGRRRDFLAARAGIAPEVQAAEADALAAAIRTLDLPPVVCAYVPTGNEPGSTALLEVMVGRGARLLLPVMVSNGQLRWAEYHGADSLVPGRHGIPTPSGPTLPTEAIAAAGLILIPALAVDRAGIRLGRGAGHYDRTLPHADPRARLVAVVRDNEVVPRLPAEPHDVPVGWILTPTVGLIPVQSM